MRESQGGRNPLTYTKRESFWFFKNILKIQKPFKQTKKRCNKLNKLIQRVALTDFHLVSSEVLAHTSYFFQSKLKQLNVSNRIFVGRQHFRVSLPWILHLPEKDLGGNGFSGLNGSTSIACESLPFSGTGSNNSAIATKK